MNKESLKNILDDYWYDVQYLKEKTKELNSINILLKTNSPASFKQIKKHEEHQISQIIENKKYVETLFQNLHQPYRTIMYMKYISFLTFDQIADKMNYSTKRIYQLHSEGLNIILNNINSEKNIIKN